MKFVIEGKDLERFSCGALSLEHQGEDLVLRIPDGVTDVKLSAYVNIDGYGDIRWVRTGTYLVGYWEQGRKSSPWVRANTLRISNAG